MKETAKLLAEVYIISPLHAIFANVLPVFLAIYFFFAGLPYGNEPVKVELTYEVKTEQTQYTDGDRVNIQANAKNIGRPFYGHQYAGFAMNCSVFQTVDGERKWLSVVDYPRAIPAVADTKTIIKNGEVQTIHYNEVLQNAAPGWYDLEIVYKLFDGTTFSQVFENVIEVI